MAQHIGALAHSIAELVVHKLEQVVADTSAVELDKLVVVELGEHRLELAVGKQVAELASPELELVVERMLVD